ncbi:MAG: extracellular solute-binding protein [Treponema sp.]|jgi:ABC-type glycerol-3-phosphate transport system substrate-binding protein|nr:extracellular solute-binding protein [Treponema sp.]
MKAMIRPLFFRLVFPCVISWIVISCGFDGQAAVLWTDRPEFVFYAEQFNAAQDRYKVEVYYYESPVQKLDEGGAFPDMAAASWLKDASAKVTFRPLDDLFNKEVPGWAAFYPRLLDTGKIEGKQYLLPVSFNIPAMVFLSEYSQYMSNPFTITMEEIMTRSREFNAQSNGVYTRMGFSPTWNENFLFIVAVLLNAGFHEAAPLAWDADALEQAMLWVRQWISETNTDIQAEDDFVFKYMYDPPAKLISSGRILFTYMDSSEIFTLSEERRANLDFRWIAENDNIPLDEASVYFGIHKKAKAKNAAYAFARWFFQADTQRMLLETSKSKRLMETSFGIGGGFSAMRNVTEQVFPQFYPSLLGRMPPESFLLALAILPHHWMSIKERVILPYLKERVRHTGEEEIRPLDRRVADWYRLNRE